MRTRIQQKLYCNWPGEIRKRLMSLTLRDWSGMRSAIFVKKDLTTFVLFENDQPVGWALTEWDHHNKVYDIMLYVRRNKRRLGYGRRLLTKAKRWVKAKGRDYFVFPDPYNELFFRKMGEKI